MERAKRGTPRTDFRGGDRLGVGLLLEARAATRSARARAVGEVREALLDLYAEIGCLILRAAGPGEKGRRRLPSVIAGLARPLSRLYGESFGAANLARMARFGAAYPGARERAGLRGLGWDRIGALLELGEAKERARYAEACLREGWSAERLAREVARRGLVASPSRASGGVFTPPPEPALDREGAAFLGCAGAAGDARERLVGRLEAFLLGSGAGLALCERSRRFQVGEDFFELDLLFFHRGLRRLLAVVALTEVGSGALKDPLSMALLWLERNLRLPGEEAPVGLLLEPSPGPEAPALRGLDGTVLPWHRGGLPPKAVLAAFYARAREEAVRPDPWQG